MFFVSSAAHLFCLSLFLFSNELIECGVSTDIPALYNSEEWILLHAEEPLSGHSDHHQGPAKATDTWKDPDAEIFVSIAEYRDSRCPVTLKNLFSKANNPKRIFVGE
jgi:hypothetical protein